MSVDWRKQYRNESTFNIYIKTWRTLQDWIEVYEVQYIVQLDKCAALYYKTSFHFRQLTLEVLLDCGQTPEFKLHQSIESHTASPVRKSLVSGLLQHTAVLLNCSFDSKPSEFFLWNCWKQLCGQEERWLNKVRGGATNIWFRGYFEVKTGSHCCYKSV